jgi:hypothetical protein
VFKDITELLQKKPYAPKRIVKNLEKHFKLREDFIFNEKEEDMREEEELNFFVQDLIVAHEISLTKIMTEAKHGKDTRLFVNLVNKWTEYNHLGVAGNLLKKGDKKLCVS